MTKYINADALVKKAYDEAEAMEEPLKSNFGILVDWIVGKTPAADVRKNIRGKWEIAGAGEGEGAVVIEYHRKKCSKCGYEYTMPFTHNFCPKCGAKMEVEWNVSNNR